MRKIALIAATAAAIAIVGVCGVQLGWVVSHHGVTQASAPAAPAKGVILKTDGGGGM